MLLASPRTPIIEVERRIRIAAPLPTVFALAADLRHDARWRREIHRTLLDGPAPGPGVVATEDAFLSPTCPHALTRLGYVAYEPERYVRCTALAGEAAWQDVERRFQPAGPAHTDLTYTLRFELAVVQRGLRLAPPQWLLRGYTRWMMGRYLRRLQRLLERGAAA
ncbi:SRPBCC family protein [Hymenobacter sp. 15J16-1T3B]|uniref:SRPBCC family protein n=1 Tax=Hymenobacter sp. 15J16-1T3B TaxID=2886941 RepID=UPI001D11A081|nr:SRPBCC family protein [Hymenobacter sp. 15J16-1T3B]MCC3160354.1 SRPBCC family protein [Hymenobacter sp. 15J16-1T3B]